MHTLKWYKVVSVIHKVYLNIIKRISSLINLKIPVKHHSKLIFIRMAEKKMTIEIIRKDARQLEHSFIVSRNEK